MSKLTSPNIRKQAVDLRRSGNSYSQINAKLGVAKSTLSNWLNADPFSQQVKSDNIKKAKLAWANNIAKYNKRRHAAHLEKIKRQLAHYAEEVPTIRTRDLFFLALGLYWGEGSKREERQVRLTNSDPELIAAAMRFFVDYCRIPVEKIHPVINVHSNVDIEEAKKYWSGILNMKIGSMAVYTVVSKAGRNKRPTHRLPYGTMQLRIRNAEFTRRIHGWLQGVKVQLQLPK